MVEVKEFKTEVRYNLSKNQNEVNCVGFFQGGFFTLVELLDRQDDVWAWYKRAMDLEDKNKAGVLYEALEHMRVALIKRQSS